MNDYNTEIYTAETPTTKITYWVTTEFPNYAAVQEQLKNAGQHAQQARQRCKNSVPDTSNIKGLPVKTQIVKDGQTVTITIASAKDEPVADADMVPPEGYSEVKMPSFDGAGGGAPAPPQ